MADWKQPLRTVLCEHLPTTIADVIVQRLAEKISRETSGDIHSPDQILTEVARWLKVYLKPDKATDCLNHLRSIWNTRQPEVSTASFITEVIQNGDVVRIRQQASEFVYQSIPDNLLSVRVSAVVSELARNMVQHADGGLIQIKLIGTGAEIRAVDRGPGIRDLDSVLNGTCRSSNGLGIGLIGVKEVANRFDVQTQAGVGTTITVLLQAT